MASKSSKPALSAKAAAILAAIVNNTFDENSATFEELLALEAETARAADPLRITEDGSSRKFACIWVTNLQRNYERLLQIVGISSFLSCQVREHFTKNGEKYADLGVDSGVCREIVERFLDSQFVYNANIHIGEMRKRSPTDAQKNRFRAVVIKEKVRRAKELKSEIDALNKKVTESSFRNKLLLMSFTSGSESAASVESILKQFSEHELLISNTATKASLLTERLGLLETTADEAAILATLSPDASLEKRQAVVSEIYDNVHCDVSPAEEMPIERHRREMLHTTIPQDFGYYYSVYFRDNYAALRNATELIFQTKSFLEEAIMVYDLFDNEEDAYSYARSHAADKLPIEVIAAGSPVFIGPFEKNQQAVEYQGAGWVAYKAMMDYQREESAVAEKMVSHIMRVRGDRSKSSVPANPSDIAEYARFAESLREERSTRTLTTVEEELLTEAEKELANDEKSVKNRASQYESISRGRQDALTASAEAELDEPGNEEVVTSNMYVSNPDTGNMSMRAVFMPTDKAEAEQTARQRHRGAAVVRLNSTNPGSSMRRQSPQTEE